MKILSAAYLRAIIRTNSDVDKVTKLLNPYDGKNLTEAEKKKVMTISTDFFKRTLKYFDEVNSAFKKVKEKNNLYYVFYTKYAFAAHQAGDKKKVEFAVGNLDDEKFDTADCNYIYCIYLTEKVKSLVTTKQYRDANVLADLALYCLKRAESLPYWGLINRDYMQSYESTLHSLIDECKYNLQQDKTPKNST